MKILGDICAYLASKGPVAALVAGRVSESRARRDAPLPYIILELAGHEPTYSMTGETGTHQTDIEVTCWAESAVKSLDISQAVRDALSGYNANLGRRSRNVSVLITDHYSGYDSPDDGSDRGAYYSLIRFSVCHNEPLPTGVPSGSANG